MTRADRILKLCEAVEPAMGLPTDQECPECGFSTTYEDDEGKVYCPKCGWEKPQESLSMANMAALDVDRMLQSSSGDVFHAVDLAAQKRRVDPQIVYTQLKKMFPGKYDGAFALGKVKTKDKEEDLNAMGKVPSGPLRGKNPITTASSHPDGLPKKEFPW